MAEILEISRQNNIAPLSPWFAQRMEHEIPSGRFLTQDGIEKLTASIIERLAAYKNEAGLSTVVLGMSGGVDSALTAALLKAAGWIVVGHTLPIEQDPVETARGIEACESLGIKHVQIELSEMFRAMSAHLNAIDGTLYNTDNKAVRIRLGNIRARLRMTALYDQAQKYGGLVASTDNLSELTAGFWTLHGDVGDISPIQSMLKSWEVPAMARAIGVPERTWRATPTDGLGIDNGDEAQLGASYLEWDLVLLAMFDAMKSGRSMDNLFGALRANDDPHAQEVISNMTSRMGKSWFKRVNPICLTYPGQDRYDQVEALDRALFQPGIMRRI